MLSADPIDATNSGDQWKRLLYEWLGLYFDGETHTVAGEALEFPQCAVLFGPGVPSNDGTTPVQEIHIVSQPLAQSRASGSEGYLWRERHRISFYCYAVSGRSRADANERAQTVGRRLQLLLRDPAAGEPLAHHGLTRTNVRPMETIETAAHNIVVVHATFRQLVNYPRPT